MHNDIYFALTVTTKNIPQFHKIESLTIDCKNFENLAQNEWHPIDSLIMQIAQVSSKWQWGRLNKVIHKEMVYKMYNCSTEAFVLKLYCVWDTMWIFLNKRHAYII